MNKDKKDKTIRELMKKLKMMEQDKQRIIGIFLALQADMDSLLQEYIKEEDRLTDERDRAQIEVCRHLATNLGGHPITHAIERGWYCFNDENEKHMFWDGKPHHKGDRK